MPHIPIKYHIDGKQYVNDVHALKELKISKRRLENRVLSKNYPTWFRTVEGKRYRSNQTNYREFYYTFDGRKFDYLKGIADYLGVVRETIDRRIRLNKDHGIRRFDNHGIEVNLHNDRKLRKGV